MRQILQVGFLINHQLLSAGVETGLSEEDCDLLDTIYVPSKYPIGSVLPNFNPDRKTGALCVELAELTPVLRPLFHRTPFQCKNDFAPNDCRFASFGNTQKHFRLVASGLPNLLFCPFFLKALRPISEIKDPAPTFLKLAKETPGNHNAPHELDEIHYI